MACGPFFEKAAPRTPALLGGRQIIDDNAAPKVRQ